MKLSPISRSKFPAWKTMRKDLYRTLDDTYHDQEMLNIIESNLWFCQFIEDENKQIIGLVEMSSRNIVDGCLSSPVAYLEGLYLKPKYRRKGLGKKVMNIILDWCMKEKFSELATDTELTNMEAQNFYKNIGFQETDRIVEFRVEVNKANNG